MKRLALITGLAVMACIPLFAKSSFLDAFTPRLDGLFGYKFGDRMPSNAAVLPSPDGTLLAPLDPKEPEFIFQEYFACLLPQTRVIVGFAAVNTFGDDELDKCNKVYAVTKRTIETRYLKKMVTLPPTESGVGNAQSVLQNCGVELADKRWVMLQTAKNNPGGYLLRLIVLNMNAIQGTMEQRQKAADSLPTLDGLFGRKLGVRVPPSNDEIVVANGLRLQVFEPEKKFLDFELYGIQILPQSRKVCGILAINNFNERFSASQCYAKVCQLLEQKFGQKLTDATANFNPAQPDADGEQMLKCAIMSFANSLRFIEVHFYKDVDENVFHVRISANDISLVNTLEAEKKTKASEASDANALDAL